MRVQGDPEQPSMRSGKLLISFVPVPIEPRQVCQLPAAPDVQKVYLWGGPDGRQSCWGHHNKNRNRAQHDLLSP